MSRVNKAVPSRNRRKKILKMAKGYRGRSKNCFSIAIQKVEKGLCYAYRDRKVRKREFRSIWIVRMNAALREMGMRYSEFIDLATKTGVILNRKIMADLALNNAPLFKQFVDNVKAQKLVA